MQDTTELEIEAAVVAIVKEFRENYPASVQEALMPYILKPIAKAALEAAEKARATTDHDDMRAQLKAAEKRGDALLETTKKLYKEKIDTLDKVAKALEFKPYGKNQIKWAKSQEQADSIRIGESVYKYVEQALA